HAADPSVPLTRGVVVLARALSRARDIGLEGTAVEGYGVLLPFQRSRGRAQGGNTTDIEAAKDVILLCAVTRRADFPRLVPQAGFLFDRADYVRSVLLIVSKALDAQDQIGMRQGMYICE